jgi:hypothetical protein
VIFSVMTGPVETFPLQKAKDLSVPKAGKNNGYRATQTRDPAQVPGAGPRAP